MNIEVQAYTEKKLLISGMMFLLAILVGSILLLVFQPEVEPGSLRVRLEGADEVTAGGEIAFAVMLTNPTGELTNVSLEHRIVDSEGVLVAKRTDEIELGDYASIGIRMNVPETSVKGPAVVKTGVRYNNRFALATLNFNILAAFVPK